MVKHNAQGSDRRGATSGRIKIEFPMPERGSWTRRDENSVRFMAMRKAGGRFKGVRREV